MAEIDAQLLKVAGLSAARVGEILHRSRQAISRGVRTDGSGYFNADEVHAIYEAALRETPAAAKTLREFITQHYEQLGREAEGASRSLAEVVAASRRLWIVLPDFHEVKEAIWPDLQPILLDTSDYTIDVFCADQAGYSSFSALASPQIIERKKERSNAVPLVRMWQPNPNIELLTHMLIFNPTQASTASAFGWTGAQHGANFARLSHIEAARLGKRFLTRLLDTPQQASDEKVRIRTLPDGLESVDKEAALDRLAS